MVFHWIAGSSPIFFPVNGQWIRIYKNSAIEVFDFFILLKADYSGYWKPVKISSQSQNPQVAHFKFKPVKLQQRWDLNEISGRVLKFIKDYHAIGVGGSAFPPSNCTFCRSSRKNFLIAFNSSWAWLLIKRVWWN